MDTSWRTAAEKLLNSLPFGHADAAAIVVGCQQFPLDERGPMMIAALARRFGTEVGLDAGEYGHLPARPGARVKATGSPSPGGLNNPFRSADGTDRPVPVLLRTCA